MFICLPLAGSKWNCSSTSAQRLWKTQGNICLYLQPNHPCSPGIKRRETILTQGNARSHNDHIISRWTSI